MASNIKNRKARNAIRNTILNGGDFIDFCLNYTGGLEREKLEKFWQEEIGPNQFNEEELIALGNLLKSVAIQLRQSRKDGVEDWALASFMGLDEESFKTLMQVLSGGC